MKRVLHIVGALTGILLIYFFLQYSNYAIFPTHIGTMLDCSVERSITSSELTEISQKHNVTTFTTEYDNTSFFSRKISFKFLNVNSKGQTSFGLQKNLLPTTQVYYTEQGGEATYIQRFWVAVDEGTDFNSFAEELEDHTLAYEQFIPVRLSILNILNTQNLYFFISVCLLLLFCNFVQPIMRCDETTMKELYEGSIVKVTIPGLFNNSRLIFIPYMLISGIFGAYILLRNSTFIIDYLQTFFAFGLILFTIFIVSKGLISAIIRKALPPSSSTKKTYSFFSILVLAFGFITACLLFSASQNTFRSIMKIKMFGQGVSSTNNFSVSYITTSKIPDDISMELLLSAFDEIDMNGVYNYAHPANSLGYEEFNDKEARNRMYWNAPTVRMSYNMLDHVPIYESSGKLLRKEDFDQEKTTLLIPDHLKENTDTILQIFNGGQYFEVLYIQDNQEHFDILDPRQKVINAKYMLTPVEKIIYYTNGEVLFDENTARVIERKLDDFGFDQGTISLMKLSADYERIEGELILALIFDGLMWIMDAVCFFTVTIFGGVVCCRLRKKVIYE